MRTSIEWNNPCVSQHLVPDRHAVAGLCYQIVVVVTSRERRNGVVDETALRERTILPRVRWTAAGCSGLALGQAFSSFRRQRRESAQPAKSDEASAPAWHDPC